MCGEAMMIASWVSKEMPFSHLNFCSKIPPLFNLLAEDSTLFSSRKTEKSGRSGSSFKPFFQRFHFPERIPHQKKKSNVNGQCGFAGLNDQTIPSIKPVSPFLFTR